MLQHLYFFLCIQNFSCQGTLKFYYIEKKGICYTDKAENALSLQCSNYIFLPWVNSGSNNDSLKVTLFLLWVNSGSNYDSLKVTLFLPWVNSGSNYDPLNVTLFCRG